MKRVIERRRGPKGIQAPSEQHCGIVTTWRTVRSETPLGVVGVVAVVAADPSPPLSNTYAPPKADFTMDCTTIPTEARLPMISCRVIPRYVNDPPGLKAGIAIGSRVYSAIIGDRSITGRYIQGEESDSAVTAKVKRSDSSNENTRSFDIGKRRFRRWQRTSDSLMYSDIRSLMVNLFDRLRKIRQILRWNLLW
nr:PREDICTED: uncharacterized protein LOC105670991 isoform X1 [Linepithema humile]